MKGLALSFLCLIFFTGCSVSSNSKSDKHQMELTMHKLRTEVDEIKHDLNTYEIEHHVLEGKLIDQEQTITKLKTQMAGLKQGALENFAQEMQNLDKKITQLTKKQEKIASDIRQLSSHANETTTALSQYKEKITQFERTLALQKDELQNILRQKASLTKQATASPVYTVKSGDSLEKIAREHGTTAEAIKELNHLTNDLIVVGQQIYLP